MVSVGLESKKESRHNGVSFRCMNSQCGNCDASRNGSAQRFAQDCLTVLVLGVLPAVLIIAGGLLAYSG